jgi:hypothetical protein
VREFRCCVPPLALKCARARHEAFESGGVVTIGPTETGLAVQLDRRATAEGKFTGERLPGNGDDEAEAADIGAFI